MRHSWSLHHGRQWWHLPKTSKNQTRSDSHRFHPERLPYSTLITFDHTHELGLIILVRCVQCWDRPCPSIATNWELAELHSILLPYPACGSLWHSGPWPFNRLDLAQMRQDWGLGSGTSVYNTLVVNIQDLHCIMLHLVSGKFVAVPVGSSLPWHNRIVRPGFSFDLGCCGRMSDLAKPAKNCDQVLNLTAAESGRWLLLCARWLHGWRDCMRFSLFKVQPSSQLCCPFPNTTVYIRPGGWWAPSLQPPELNPWHTVKRCNLDIDQCVCVYVYNQYIYTSFRAHIAGWLQQFMLGMCCCHILLRAHHLTY